MAAAPYVVLNDPNATDRTFQIDVLPATKPNYIQAMGTVCKQRRAVGAAALGLLIIAAYALVGVLQILVWNPLAAVPGATLEEIYTDMARANESISIPVVVTWGVLGAGLASLVLAGTLTRRIRGVRQVLVIDLLLLVLGAPSLWAVSFSPGMSLADAFAISGGDHAPWGTFLSLLSALALVPLVAIASRRVP